ncbi:hypothetical protein ZHAS_00003152 [Anopheles sinensis]|uniref:Uncharacterized protein n=1 Tax=Anopheles sinensis TaxID=74873 RepID=A0A084VDR4_ANOSI|nr:hypothetical protein ZHAS_00003152 [Anopheles sinensis]
MILSNVIKLSRPQSPPGGPGSTQQLPSASAIFLGGDECVGALQHTVDRERHGGGSMGLSDDGSSLLDGMALEGGSSGGGWCMDTTSCPSMTDET